MVSSAIVSTIGGLATFFEIIISAFIGLWLLKNFKFALIANMVSLSRGEIAPDSFIKLNLAMAIGAVLLIVPGFLTDIIGILLQFEFVALIISKRLYKPKQNNNFKYTKQGGNDVIDVEIVDNNYTAIK